MPSAGLLEFIKKSLIEDSTEYIFVNTVLKIEPNKIPFILATLAEKAIVYSNPYRGKLNETNLRKALICSSEYSRHHTPTVDSSPASSWRELIRLMEQQVHFQKKAKPTPVAVLWYLFTNLAQQEEFKSQFNLNEKFSAVTGCDIESFLYTTICCWVLGRESTLYFTQNDLQNVEGPRIQVPTEIQISNALKLLSGGPTEFRALRDKDNRVEKDYANFSPNFLRIYPVVQPDKTKDKMIVLFPDLLVSQAINLIYHKLHNKYDQTFDQWFGRLFERLCEDTLSACLPADSLITESEIKAIYEKARKKAGKDQEIADFIGIERQTGIIFESKTARIRKGLISTDLPDELKKSLLPICKGLSQISDLHNTITQSENHHPKLKDVKEFIGIVITLELFFAINTENLIRPFIRQTLKADCNSSIDIPWICTDIFTLIQLQPYFKRGLIYLELVELTLQSQEIDVMKKIVEKYGECPFEDSFLDPYFEEYWAKLIKDE